MAAYVDLSSRGGDAAAEVAAAMADVGSAAAVVSVAPGGWAVRVPVASEAAVAEAVAGGIDGPLPPQLLLQAADGEGGMGVGACLAVAAALLRQQAPGTAVAETIRARIDAVMGLLALLPQPCAITFTVERAEEQVAKVAGFRKPPAERVAAALRINVDVPMAAEGSIDVDAMLAAVRAMLGDAEAELMMEGSKGDANRLKNGGDGKKDGSASARDDICAALAAVLSAARTLANAPTDEAALRDAVTALAATLALPSTIANAVLPPPPPKANRFGGAKGTSSPAWSCAKYDALYATMYRCAVAGLVAVANAHLACAPGMQGTSETGRAASPSAASPPLSPARRAGGALGSPGGRVGQQPTRATKTSVLTVLPGLSAAATKVGDEPTGAAIAPPKRGVGAEPPEPIAMKLVGFAERLLIDLAARRARAGWERRVAQVGRDRLELEGVTVEVSEDTDDGRWDAVAASVVDALGDASATTTEGLHAAIKKTCGSATTATPPGTDPPPATSGAAAKPGGGKLSPSQSASDRVGGGGKGGAAPLCLQVGEVWYCVPDGLAELLHSSPSKELQAALRAAAQPDARKVAPTSPKRTATDGEGAHPLPRTLQLAQNLFIASPGPPPVARLATLLARLGAPQAMFVMPGASMPPDGFAAYVAAEFGGAGAAGRGGYRQVRSYAGFLADYRLLVWGVPACKDAFATRTTSERRSPASPRPGTRASSPRPGGEGNESPRSSPRFGGKGAMLYKSNPADDIDPAARASPFGARQQRVVPRGDGGMEDEMSPFGARRRLPSSPVVRDGAGSPASQRGDRLASREKNDVKEKEDKEKEKETKRTALDTPPPPSGSLSHRMKGPAPDLHPPPRPPPPSQKEMTHVLAVLPGADAIAMAIGARDAVFLQAPAVAAVAQGVAASRTVLATVLQAELRARLSRGVRLGKVVRPVQRAVRCWVARRQLPRQRIIHGAVRGCAGLVVQERAERAALASAFRGPMRRMLRGARVYCEVCELRARTATMDVELEEAAGMWRRFRTAVAARKEAEVRARLDALHMYNTAATALFSKERARRRKITAEEEEAQKALGVYHLDATKVARRELRREIKRLEKQQRNAELGAIRRAQAVPYTSHAAPIAYTSPRFGAATAAPHPPPLRAMFDALSPVPHPCSWSSPASRPRGGNGYGS